MKILDELDKFIQIQSVSTQRERKKEILKACDFLKEKLNNLGFEVKILKEKENPPLILATFLKNFKKTIGIYGHYDVQPEDPIDQWLFPPFKLTIKNKKLYGRGIADNKGHIILNLFAIEELIKSNQLNKNVVFILEGEEESGSPNFEKYIRKIKNILRKVDVFYLTDVGMKSKNQPTIYYALRGIVYFELTVIANKTDLHSGSYGNVALNPAQVLAELFSKMKDSKTNKILIPNFYKDVRKMSKNEIEMIKQNDPKMYPAKIFPSMDINGIVSGYIGEGVKTIIPADAKAKFSFRLIEYQKPEKIIKLVKEFIKKNLSSKIKYNLKVHAQSAPFYTNLDNEYVIKTKKALEKIFKNKVIFDRVGGSIPPAEILQRNFKKPIILTGFTLPDSNVHAPNENFDEKIFFKGLEALKLIYQS